MNEYIASLRSKELKAGTTKAESFIDTPNGPVILQADNWRAIADVLEKASYDGDETSKALCRAKGIETTVAADVPVSDIGERRVYDKFATFSERAFRPSN